ncbi:MAG: hypothetical protein CSA11_06600 [Chloroflexi bacterium]|nr:MAG: hypothetical protein CSA11_06600 [Chloroflexota bacterium]
MRRKQWWLFALTLGTIILVGIILTDALPYFRGPAPETSAWYWPYQLRPLQRWWAPIGAAWLMLLAAGWWLRTQRGGWVTVTAVLLLIITSLLLQLGLVYAHKPAVFPELIDRTLSHLASGFFQTAVEIDDLRAVLRSYPAAMPGFTSEHARTHPPGLVLTNWLTIQLFDRLPGLSALIAPSVWAARCTDLWLLNRPASVAAALATWALLPILMAALTIWPAYLLARQLLSISAAKVTAVLTATLPSLLLFAPKSVQLFAPGTILILWAFHLALVKWSKRWFLFAGFLFSLATFFSLGYFAFALLLWAYALLMIWQQKSWQTIGWSHIIGHGALFGLGGLSIWLSYWLVWSVPPWQIWQTGLSQHYELVTSHRRYDWWLIWNLVDLMVYAGLPLLIGYLAGVVDAFKNGRSPHLTPINKLALTLFAFVLFLNLSGSARGEVGRIWLFFMPLLALVAADFWDHKFPGWKTAVLLIALQLSLTVSLGLAWQPVRAVIVIAAEPTMPTSQSPDSRLNVAFIEPGLRPATITLQGTTIAFDKAALDVTLFWQSNRPAKRPFTVFVQLLDKHGQIITQQDNWPVNGQWPPTCWTPNQPVIDTYQLSLPPDLPPGPFTLITGLYDAHTNTRLATTTGSDFIQLQSIQFP